MSGELRFEFVWPTGCADLEEMWRALQARAPHAFFLDWGWIGAWLSEAEGVAGALIGRVDARVVLLGVFMPRARPGLARVPVQGLYLHDTGQESMDVITIEYNGFLVDPDWRGRAEPAAVQFLLDRLRIGTARCVEVHMKGVADPFEIGAPGAGLRGEVMARQPSWGVDLAALRAAGRDYLPGLSANTRYQIRRAMRLYAQRGKLVAERARDVAEGLEFLDRLKALHQSYWRGRGEPGAFSFPFFERFQRRLIKASLPEGKVELLRVRAGAEDIGYLYNFIHDGRVLAYQSGFRYEADPRLKPGLVSHTLCIERHLREAVTFYDFLAGEARYKASLGDPGPTMTYWRIERPTLLLRLERGIRAAMRRIAADTGASRS